MSNFDFFTFGKRKTHLDGDDGDDGEQRLVVRRDKASVDKGPGTEQHQPRLQRRTNDDGDDDDALDDDGPDDVGA